MKRKFTIIGIQCIIILLSLIPLMSLSQTTSTSSDNNKNYCFNETQYRGILRLYTNYEESLCLIEDFEYRLHLKDTAFFICSQNFISCSSQLEKTNKELEVYVAKSLFSDTEIKRLKRQRNYIVLGGFCITTGLLLFIFTR